jgi:hypothetical protein
MERKYVPPKRRLLQRRHIPGNSSLHCYRRENTESYYFRFNSEWGGGGAQAA